jgi:hypothetical protein
MGSLMKTAMKTVKAVELTCPHCEETISAPGGDSFFWTVDDLELAKSVIVCTGCGKPVKLPKVKR